MGVTVLPREIEDNTCARFWRTDKVYYGRCANGECCVRASKQGEREEVEEGRESGTFTPFSTSAFRLLPRAFASLANT